MSHPAFRTRRATILGSFLAALALAAQAQVTRPKTARPPALQPERTGVPGEEEKEKEDQVERTRFRLLTLQGKDKQYDPNALIRAKRHMAAMRRSAAAWPMQKQAADWAPAPSAPRAANIAPAAWTSIGPGNIGGRTRAIVTHPADPNILYAGAVGGGVWKSFNAGSSWAPLNDFMASIAVTTMVMDPANPDILYAGTGEGYPGDGLRGAGVFKTVNAGVTWTQLASTADPTFHYINRLAIHPATPSILLMASRGGLHRSTDGGATWTARIQEGSCDDVDFHPTDGSLAVATCYGFSSQALWSADGGVTWAPATGTSVPSCRTEIAYARSNPGVVYASADANMGELYRSLDGGRTFSLRNTGSAYLGGQGWYDNALWIDPLDPDNLMLGGVGMYRSTDAGQTIDNAWYGDLHADQHIIVHAQDYSAANRRLYVGNDGGIYRTNDFLNLGIHPFTGLNNDYAVTQFYGGNGHPTVNLVLGGTQDNGTPRYAGVRNAWLDHAGADGGMVAVDPRVGAGGVVTVYGEIQNGYLWRMKFNSAGENLEYNYMQPGDMGFALWVAPIVLDPNNPDRLYQGRQRLWRLDGPRDAPPGTPWTPVSPEGDMISAIAVAKGNPDIIWIGGSGGSIRMTTNGTSANPTWLDRSVPARSWWYVTRLAIDPSNHNRVYATFGGFNADNVYRTENGGLTWTDITGNLPEVPVRSLVVHPHNTDFIYIGTEAGVFASEDRGGDWSPANDGPTNASVDELFWVGNRLHAATHGRGMWSITVNTPPTAAITAPAAGQGFPAGSDIAISASAADVDGAISRVEFLQGATVLGSDATSPYSITWNAVPAGTYDLVARAVDNDGGTGNSAAVRITVGSAPGISLPGRIQAEDYMAGGQGTGYNDLTPGNTGGAYRTDAVDIQAATDAGGGFNVGWIQAGEWLAYEVNVTQAGTYTLTARMASGIAAGSAARTLVMSVDGVAVATFSLADFGGWQAWRDVTVPGVNLAAGPHLVRLTMSNGDFNVNYVDAIRASNQAPISNAGPDQTVPVNTVVTLDGRGSSDPDNGPSALSYAWTQVSGPAVPLNNPASAQPTFNAGTVGTYVFHLVVNDGAAASAPDTVRVTAGSGVQYIELPGRLQAEDYRPGGAGIGYRDLTAGNQGGAYRTDDVDIEAAADAGGGHNVGWIDATEWLAYDVRVAATGAYALTARVASGAAGAKSFRLLIDGVQAAVFSFTENSGWQGWRDVTVRNVNLTAGVHLLTLEMGTAGFNLNYVDVTPEAAGISLPGRIQAEDYKAGGQGTSYNDLTAGNTGGAYRTDDVDIEATADAGGGFNVGWIQAGEWLAYDVNVASSGTYTLTARMASGAGPGTRTLVMSVDGVTVATFDLTDNAGWQAWRDVIVSGVDLAAGPHAVRLTASTGDFNVNHVDVQPGSAPELLVNGAFADGLAGWSTLVSGSAAAAFSVDAGSAKAAIAAQGGQPWEIQIHQPVPLVAGKSYTLEFDVKAEAVPKHFKVVVEHNGDPWTKYHEQQYTVTAAPNTFQRFSITWVQPATDANVRVGFHFGTFNVSDVWLDNASLK
jgi:hypothetical protein